MAKSFLSVVTVARNAAPEIARVIERLAAVLDRCAEDYELIVVDNGSNDGTVAALEEAVARIHNVQVYCLVARCELAAAFLAGMEQAVGDHVLLFDPEAHSADAIPSLVAAARGGAQVALAAAAGRPASLGYRLLSGGFVRAFRAMTGVDLRTGANFYRIMDRRVVNYVLQHDTASLAHQALPALGGFKAAVLPCGGAPLLAAREADGVWDGVRRAAALVTSTSTVPLRLATLACAAGAVLSLAYSAYVVGTYALKAEVAPGWTTLSLQISGLFCLLSVAVGLLSEYVLGTVAAGRGKPAYYVAREFRSKVISREAKLNVVAGDGAAAA